MSGLLEKKWRLLLPRRSCVLAGAIDAPNDAPNSMLELFLPIGAIHGELMFTQPRKYARSASRQPDHVAKITPTLSVSVWQSHDAETGNVRMHWDVSRIGRDPSRTYKTLTVQSLLEFPAFLARVATGFAQAEGIGAQLRQELIQFAKEMELIATRRESNGVDFSESKEGNSVRF